MMKRLAAVVISAVAATTIGVAPVTTAGAEVAADHPTGSPGLYNPRDQNGTHNGVTCHYSSSGKLHTVSVITPKAQPLHIYTSTHRRSYVLWAAQLQHRINGHWLMLGGWHKAPEKLMTAKATWQTLKPLGAIGVSKAQVNATYRVLERIQWKDYNSHTALIGSVTHLMNAYYYGPKTALSSSCHDQRPTAGSFSSAVLAGQPLTVDLAPHTKDADHDKLRLEALSVKENGTQRLVSFHSDGVLTTTTSTDEAGNSVIVRYDAVDPAGVHSAVGTLTIHIQDETPGVPGEATVSNVTVTAHSGGNATADQADVAWAAPSTGLPPTCYDVRALRMVSPDAIQPFVADTSATQTFTCQTGTLLSNAALTPDNEGNPNYVLWEVRAVSKTNLDGPWTTAASATVPDERGLPGPDAFQVLRYSGYWINSNPSDPPPTCDKKDTVESQTPFSGPSPAGTKIVMTEYDETGC